MMAREPADQPVPHMAPPLLVETATGLAVAEMPAICLWLGERFGLLPAEPHARALAMKIVNDANDVLDEMTLDGGRLMWTNESWADYRPRLLRWMRIWEASLAQGLLPEAAGMASIVTATLWGTMTERLPQLRPLLDAEAPPLAALTDRLRREPALARQAEKSRERFGDVWCGGEIEASLRKVLEG